TPRASVRSSRGGGISSITFSVDGYSTGWSSLCHQRDLPRGRHLVVGGVTVAPGDQLHYEACPSRLVRRPQTGAGVAMEVLVEPQEILPAVALLEQPVRPVRGPAPVRAGQK